MSGFDAAWLAQRAGADARARSRPLAARLAVQLEARMPSGGPGTALHIVDLGCGTGANLRWLAPRLPWPQAWRCIDDSPALLAQVEATARLAGEALRDLAVDTCVADLRHELATLLGPAPQLVTASALLDLVSRDWLSQLVDVCSARRTILLFALSYDGRLEFSPAHRADAALVAAFNAHQRRDKGFGPALGPAAHDAALELLRQRGWSCEAESSDWRLGAGDTALLVPLLEGLAHAAMEQQPQGTQDFGAWRDQRLAQARAGVLSVVVGHGDLLALPPGPPQ